MNSEADTERVRKLNVRGIRLFREHLERLREDGSVESPVHLLTDPGTTTELEAEVLVSRRPFEDRMDAARYLDGVLEGVPAVEEDVGLWSWLSLYYFDQVCPPRRSGARPPGRDYRHILEPGYPYGHRHLLAGPVLVYRLSGDDAPLLLRTRLDRENNFHHELASRQAFITNPAILGAVHLLYWDEARQRPKRRAQEPGQQPGTLRRFVDVVQQLDVNYDLYSMTPEAIVGLLPDEFRRWKPQRRPFSRHSRR